MSKGPRTIIRYSIGFKQKVVGEIEQEGLSISAAARRYGIKGAATIQSWLRKFGKNQLLNKIVRVEMQEEKDRIKALESQIKELKLALADSTMENHLLNTLIKLVDEHYQTDVKKNLGQQSSGKPAKKKGMD